MSDAAPYIYLDNAATTRPDPRVVAAMVGAMRESFGNPSSLHRVGIAAERLVKRARKEVARALGRDVAPSEIVFTSGGTEADVTAVLGAAYAVKARGRVASDIGVVATTIEHPAVMASCDQLEREGFAVRWVPIDASGCVDPEAVGEACDDRTAVVAVMQANNELGTIQPVAEVIRAVRSRAPRAVIHVDAVQSFPWMAVEPHALGADTVAISAHKVHGPKGAGALWVRRGLELAQRMLGGSQEAGRRGGTENVPGIVGLGTAAALFSREREADWKRVAELRDRFVASATGSIADVRVTGDPARRTPHIASLAVRSVASEPLLHALEGRGVLVSSGAACHAGGAKPSHVLTAIGEEPGRSDRAYLRISLCRSTTTADVDAGSEALRAAVAELRR